MANSMVTQMEKSSSLQKVSLDQAASAVDNGGLAIIGYNNPNGHGHVATIAEGTNNIKGDIANIGANNGFKSLSQIFSKNTLANKVEYFTLKNTSSTNPTSSHPNLMADMQRFLNLLTHKK